jgi:hypothetical protein
MGARIFSLTPMMLMPRILPDNEAEVRLRDGERLSAPGN